MNKTVVSVVIATVLLVIAAIPTSAKEYQVEKGDTLWGIAQMHETTVNGLKEMNQLESDLIYPKQRLQLYQNHTVEKGDTLSELAVEYNVKVDELMHWNNLTSDLIIIGQELTIKSSHSNESHKAVQTITQPDTNKEQQTLTMTATAYTAECDGCSGITYTGINLLEDRDKKVIAVDPNVIPLGTKVHVEGYGEAIAGDIGSAIKGNRIDIHVPTKEIAFDWGVRTVEVTIL